MDFDSVRAEKEDAMRRYNRQRKLKTFARVATLFSLLVLLFSLSSPMIPAAMEIAGEFKSVLYQRQYVFLLMNALVLAIYFSTHRSADVAQPDLYDEYSSKSASAAADLHFPASKMKIEVVNRNSFSPVKKIGKTTSALFVVTECSAPVTKHEIKVTETARRYRRSQSESFEKHTDTELRGELRTAETQNGRETVLGRESMEEMSSEEFRITVESFIAKKKRDLREQDINMLHSYPGVAEP